MLYFIDIDIGTGSARASRLVAPNDEIQVQAIGEQYWEQICTVVN